MHCSEADISSTFENVSENLACAPVRRASFPFCAPDLPEIPKLDSVPEHWQGIYGSVLYPPKSDDGQSDCVMQPVQNFPAQQFTYMQPVFCSNNFSGFFTDGE